jgi:hypothetical protein
MIPILQQYRNNEKQFAFIIDSRDVVFVDPLPLLLAKFNAINKGKIIYNTDGLGAMYPCGQEWFRDEYNRITNHFQAILNAGILAGSIDTFLKVMPICQTIRNALLEGKPWSGVMEHHFCDHGNWSYNDDQYLYQLCQMYYPEYFAPDIEKLLCVHLKDYPATNWRTYSDFRSGNCAGFASIFHIPDRAGHEFWKEWVAYEGNIPNLKMKYLTIGNRRPGYGNIVIGKKLGFDEKIVCLKGLEEFDETISAHANASMEIDVNEKILLAGALNETAVNSKNKVIVEFVVDGKIIDTLDTAGTISPFIDIYPGKHLLVTRATGSNKNCHSLWVIRKK